jgi:hypothetical protein
MALAHFWEHLEDEHTDEDTTLRSWAELAAVWERYWEKFGCLLQELLSDSRAHDARLRLALEDLALTRSIVQHGWENMIGALDADAAKKLRGAIADAQAPPALGGELADARLALNHFACVYMNLQRDLQQCALLLEEL